MLPMVSCGTRSYVTDAMLQRSYLWNNIRNIRLSHNIRAQSDPHFQIIYIELEMTSNEMNEDDYVCLENDI
jgi:ATP-dependent DNA helicase PIF1